MMKKLRMWEDAPERVRALYNSEDALRKKLRFVPYAVKAFPCRTCGAEKGEACDLKPSVHIAPQDVEWHKQFDGHFERESKWNALSELERKMWEAVDE